MATCKYCKKSGWFLRLDNAGLCNSCIQILAPITNRAVQIIEESDKIIEKSKRNDLYIDPIFSNKHKWIWTGDRYRSEAAWNVFFNSGDVLWDYIVNDSSVRPVRSVK